MYAFLKYERNMLNFRLYLREKASKFHIIAMNMTTGPSTTDQNSYKPIEDNPEKEWSRQ